MYDDTIAEAEREADSVLANANTQAQNGQSAALTAECDALRKQVEALRASARSYRDKLLQLLQQQRELLESRTPSCSNPPDYIWIQSYTAHWKRAAPKWCWALRMRMAASCASHSLPTRTPNETVPEMIAFFSHHAICALGVATFGPAQVHADSPEYGAILHTPKLAWQGYPLCQTLSRALNVPFACDTDVNAAALAEVRLGAARGLHSRLYLTIGTGIGGGLYCEDRLVHGMLHPEWGHMLLAPRADDPTPEGFCPFHQHCAEGLAAGPAMEKRWDVSARDLPADHPAFDLEAYYLAQVCVNALMTVSPERILLGGGVMQREGLLPRVRQICAPACKTAISQPRS